MSLGASEDALIPRAKGHHEANFDITAMIDLVFMLNIFFLVTTVAAAQMELDLPILRHCIPTPSEDCVTICILSTSPPSVSIELEGHDSKGALEEDADQKEAIARAVQDASRAGKRVILIKAERATQLRDVKRIAGYATDNSEGLELRFAAIEKE